MLGETFGLAIVLTGWILLIVLAFRLRYLPPLARQAVLGSGFGLIAVGRYVTLDHDIGGVCFGIGASVVLLTVVLRHLQAFPPVSVARPPD